MNDVYFQMCVCVCVCYFFISKCGEQNEVRTVIDAPSLF